MFSFYGSLNTESGLYCSTLVVMSVFEVANGLKIWVELVRHDDNFHNQATIFWSSKKVTQSVLDTHTTVTVDSVCSLKLHREMLIFYLFCLDRLIFITIV